jgi:hypothetical protein
MWLVCSLSPLTERSVVMGKQGKAGLLRKDKEYVKFVQLLRKAEMEGRLAGKHGCKLCGMKYESREEAQQCCRVTVS